MKSRPKKEKRPLASKALSNALSKTSQVVVRSQDCLDQRCPICVCQTLITISDRQLRASALTKTLKSTCRQAGRFPISHAIPAHLRTMIKRTWHHRINPPPPPPSWHRNVRVTQSPRWAQPKPRPQSLLPKGKEGPNAT
jgi:hypothetical protein